MLWQVILFRMVIRDTKIPLLVTPIFPRAWECPASWQSRPRTWARVEAEDHLQLLKTLTLESSPIISCPDPLARPGHTATLAGLQMLCRSTVSLGSHFPHSGIKSTNSCWVTSCLCHSNYGKFNLIVEVLSNDEY